MIAPICLFTYARLDETKRTIEALQKNYLAFQSDLFIFSDGPGNEQAKVKVQAVRDYLKTVDGFKSVTVFESNENKGLANSIIAGVTKIIEKYGKIIVLEDDLLSQANFLNFMNDALDFYENEEHIQSVNGFSLSLPVTPSGDIYFQKRPFSWGWGTWQGRWNIEIFDKARLRKEIETDKSILKKFNASCGSDIAEMFMDSIFDRNDSWYVRWAYSHFKNAKFSVYPVCSLIENIGFGETGTHCKGINSYQYKLCSEEKVKFEFVEFDTPDSRVSSEFLKYFSLRHKLLVRLRLLASKSGREQVMSEIKMKLK